MMNFGLQVHQEGKPSFRCAWNQIDADYVVSTSSDVRLPCKNPEIPLRNPAFRLRNVDLFITKQGYACVVSVSGQRIVRKYKHPEAVFGCDWHKTNGQLFATGCQDNIVRVFDRMQDGVLHSFHGHSAKVFNVAWSTLLPHMLMSGSDGAFFDRFSTVFRPLSH